MTKKEPGIAIVILLIAIILTIIFLLLLLLLFMITMTIIITIIHYQYLGLLALATVFSPGCPWSCFILVQEASAEELGDWDVSVLRHSSGSFATSPRLPPHNSGYLGRI